MSSKVQSFLSAENPFALFLAGISFSPGCLPYDRCIFTWVLQPVPEKEMDVLLPLKGAYKSAGPAREFPCLIGMFAGSGEINNGRE